MEELLNQHFIKTLFFLSLALMLSPPHCFAYIDAGTGSMIIQMIAALIFGSLFFIQGWIAKVRTLFASKKQNQKNAK